MPIEHLPERMKPPAYRLRSWALTDKAPYLFMAGTGLSLGLSYGGAFGSYARYVHPIEDLVPVAFWTWVWCAVSIFAAIVAFLPSCRHWVKQAVLVTWTALTLIWGTSWFVAWAQGVSDRGLSRATWYILCPLLVGWSLWIVTKLYGVIAEHVTTINTQQHTICQLRAHIARLEGDDAQAA